LQIVPDKDTKILQNVSKYRSTDMEDMNLQTEAASIFQATETTGK